MLSCLRQLERGDQIIRNVSDEDTPSEIFVWKRIREKIFCLDSDCYKLFVSLSEEDYKNYDWRDYSFLFYIERWDLKRLAAVKIIKAKSSR